MGYHKDLGPDRHAIDRERPEEHLFARSCDGGWRDLGYPCTIQRPDGKIVTVYYFNDHPKTERYIAATIWDAGKR